MIKGADFKKEFNQLTSRNSIIISLIIIILGLIFFYYFVGFDKPTECKDINCYKEYLLTCKKSFLVNDEDNYVYRYKILKSNGNNYCNVEVILLKIKNGTAENEKLEGLNMICKVNKFEDILPQKNMLSCSGKLREELQEIIINKLHNTILQNLEEIKKEIK
ncbi:MAG: hypothetical protein AABW83_01810, partial [Nanoarchaeota archaeon]